MLGYNPNGVGVIIVPKTSHISACIECKAKIEFHAKSDEEKKRVRCQLLIFPVLHVIIV